ncbi:MAG TPA: hypothetical protein VM409_06100 [Chloroflexia bacterium]|nr:hypothetical protein [Chloroflexia bacterium]
MDNRTTQVNVNRPKRNGVPPWAWGALAAAALALILGTIFFLNQQPSQPAVAPTATPTSTPLITVVEVTSTPDVNAPTVTPVTVEITPTPGATSTQAPTATARIIQVTATSAPTTAAPPTVTTASGGTTPSVVGTPGGQATVSPQVTMTSDEQSVMTLLTQSSSGLNVTSVRYDGTDLRVDFQPPSGATEARQQVRAMLTALAGSNLAYSKLMLTGSQTAGQGTAAIQLTYDRNTVTSTDWASASDQDVYGKAETQTLQPPYNTP